MGRRTVHASTPDSRVISGGRPWAAPGIGNQSAVAGAVFGKQDARILSAAATAKFMAQLASGRSTAGSTNTARGDNTNQQCNDETAI